MNSFFFLHHLYSFIGWLIATRSACTRHTSFSIHHIRVHHLAWSPLLHLPLSDTIPRGQLHLFAHHYIRVHSVHILLHVFKGEVHLGIGMRKAPIRGLSILCMLTRYCCWNECEWCHGAVLLLPAVPSSAFLPLSWFAFNTRPTCNPLNYCFIYHATMYCLFFSIYLCGASCHLFFLYRAVYWKGHLCAGQYIATLMYAALDPRAMLHQSCNSAVFISLVHIGVASFVIGSSFYTSQTEQHLGITTNCILSLMIYTY